MKFVSSHSKIKTLLRGLNNNKKLKLKLEKQPKKSFSRDFLLNLYQLPQPFQRRRLFLVSLSSHAFLSESISVLASWILFIKRKGKKTLKINKKKRKIWKNKQQNTQASFFINSIIYLCNFFLDITSGSFDSIWFPIFHDFYPRSRAF